MVKLKGLKGSVKFVSVDYRTINTNEISNDIHKYLMKELLQNSVFKLLKQCLLCYHLA